MERLVQTELEPFELSDVVVHWTDDMDLPVLLADGVPFFCIARDGDWFTFSVWDKPCRLQMKFANAELALINSCPAVRAKYANAGRT